MAKFFSLAVAFIVLLALLPLVALAATPAQLGALNFNLYPRPCPINELFLRDFRGNAFNLASLRGNVVILNFWRIDCHPCAMEKPILERIHQKYALRGLAIVAVNLFDSGDRIKDYLGRCRFSFRFAFDPDKRFCVKSQMLGSGRPTAFVVNPNSEAIYEIAAVPTTYLINREGQIVGQSFGVVNWEQGPLTELLESLLGRPTQSLAGLPSASPAAAEQSPLAAALQTPRQAPALPADIKTTIPPLSVSSPSQPAVSTPSAASAESGPTSTPASIPAPKAETSVSLAQGDASPRARQVGARANPSASEGPVKARQIMAQQSSSPRGKQTVQPAGQLPPPPQPPAGAGFLPRATGAAPAPATSPAASPLPSMLPRAHPYSSPGAAAPVYSTPQATTSARSRSRQPDVPLTPDPNGYVTARVPTTPEEVSNRPVSRPTPIAVRPLPAADPVGGSDTLSGFVTDSFQSGKPRSRPVAAGRQPAAAQPSAPSFFDALGKFATGIRDAVSRTLPGQ